MVDVDKDDDEVVEGAVMEGDELETDEEDEEDGEDDDDDDDDGDAEEVRVVEDGELLVV